MKETMKKEGLVNNSNQPQNGNKEIKRMFSKTTPCYKIPYGIQIERLRNYLIQRKNYLLDLDDDTFEMYYSSEIDIINNTLNLIKKNKI